MTDDKSLNVIVSGSDSRLPPVLLAHGLFGSAKNLGGLARRMENSRRVISVDMRNHGESFHDPDHSYAAMAQDLADVIAQHGGTADLVGHSMGGKAGMLLALTQPGLIRRLVVLDIAPLAYEHSQIRLIEAMQDLDLSGLKLRSDADNRLAAKVDEAGVRAFLLQSLDLKADPPRWKLNLPVLHELMAQITGWPENAPQGSFDGPTLFVGGARSNYIEAEGEAAIRRFFPQAELRKIDDAGHWLHAEQPRLVADCVAAFLA